MNEGQDWVYTDTVKDHFLNPRNFLMGDESKFKCDATGIVGNPVCGDQMKMYIKVDSDTDIITGIKWKTYGCASAIASTSALTELAQGKTLEEALEITAKDIDNYLGNLPKHKFHCSILGQEALKKAIENYRNNKSDWTGPVAILNNAYLRHNNLLNSLLVEILKNWTGDGLFGGGESGRIRSVR